MAKFNQSTPAHPLVAGFPLEVALRHIANNPISTENAKNLAVAVLKGHTEGLWGLHDELQESNHPILRAGYKWLNAADKLHLDKHTYTALNEAAERRRAEEPHAEHKIHGDQYHWRYTPESRARDAGVGINQHPNSPAGRLYSIVHSRVKELSPESTDQEIKESIRRHAHRAEEEARRRLTGSSPDISNGRALRPPTEEKKPDAHSYQNEVATRYKKKPTRYSLANKSNFIGSLLKASSPEHRLFVQRTKELARKAGAKQTKEFPALHDTPQQSVPGVALAVYGHIQPDSAHALGSWVNGLLPNSPGYAVFHARPTGPDTLYRIRMEGSGYDARAKLDRAGIPSRVFVPHKKGLDVLIPDKGNRMGQQVQAFATQQKVPVESSPGHLTTVGSQDQAQARDTFRGKVAKVGMSRVKRYGIKVTKPQKHPTKPRTRQGQSGEGDDAGLNQLPTLPSGPLAASARSPAPPRYDLPSRAKQDLGSHVETGVEPTSILPKLSSGEQNKLNHWAHEHAKRNRVAFGKFIGQDPMKVHDLLVKHITDAAHEMRRTGKNSVTFTLGNGKRLKIKYPGNPRTSWADYKIPPLKTIKPPTGMEVQPRLNPKDLRKKPKKPKKPKKLSKFERRRRTYRRLTCRL